MLALIFRGVLLIIQVFLLSTVVKYIDHLKAIGCKCAIDGQMSAILKWLSVIVAVFNTALFIVSVIKEFSIVDNKFPIVPVLVAISGISNFALSILYLIWRNKLIDDSCECSADERRELIAAYAFINMAIVAASIITAMVATGSLVSGMTYGSVRKSLNESSTDPGNSAIKSLSKVSSAIRSKIPTVRSKSPKTVTSKSAVRSRST